MNREILIRSKRMCLDPKTVIGQGGEAEVFGIGRIDPSDPELVAKIWYPPDHSQFAGTDPDSIRNREAARAKLKEYGAKLSHFPTGLPARVVTPRDLVYDGGTQEIAGYTMALLAGAEQLRSFTQRRFRDQAGVDAAKMVSIFSDLHDTVDALHARQVVIGDFNNLNVLVRDEEAHVIDADSMQFGRFACHAFTERYVDPLICDQKATRLIQRRMHSDLTDWYAFAVMFFECLMFVHPYGGVFQPVKKGDQVSLDARPLHRISVFHRNVVYPVKATPLSWLPKRAHDFFGAMLTDDRRGEFPRELLEILKAQAEGRYIDPATVMMPVRKKEIMRGDLTAKKVFSFSQGVILDAASGGNPLSLVGFRATPTGVFVRENDSVIIRGEKNSALVIKAHGDSSLLAMNGKLVVLSSHGEVSAEHPVDSYQGRFPVFATNGDHYYWLSNGQLFRDGAIGPSFIGSVLTNQTRIFMGPDFGFGFYRVGASTNGFLFDSTRSGINDSVRLPPIEGELVSAECFFSARRVWFFTTCRVQGKMVNRCTTIKADGTVTASVTAADGDGSWLGEITGHAAARLKLASNGERECLLSATDDELIIVAEENGGIAEVGKLRGLSGLADANSHLFFEPGQGLLSVTGSDVWCISHPLLM